MMKLDVPGIREWSQNLYSNWTANKDRPVYVGDVRTIIENLIIPQLNVGFYIFDNPSKWPIDLSISTQLLEIEDNKRTYLRS